MAIMLMTRKKVKKKKKKKNLLSSHFKLQKGKDKHYLVFVIPVVYIHSLVS